MNRDPATVVDIVLACRNIVGFCEGFDIDKLKDDERTQFAVLHQVIVIGEAVGRLSEHFKSEHTAIPWQEVRAMRNHLTHGYDRVNMNDLWTAVSQDVPELLAYLEPLIGEAD